MACLLVLLGAMAVGARYSIRAVNLLAAAGVTFSFLHAMRSARWRETADRERRRAESAARDAVERALVAEQAAAEPMAVEACDAMSDGLFVFDREFRYVYANGRAEEMLGKPSAELIGRRIGDARPEKLGTDFEGVYRAVMESRVQAGFEARLPNSSRWLEVRVSPNRITDGITVFFRDITELKGVREEQAGLIQVVCQANDLLHGIMEGSHDLICAIGLDYRFTAMNQAYRSAMRAMSGEEVRPGMEVTNKPSWTRALRGVESAMQEQFTLAGGEIRTFEVRYCSIRDSHEAIVGASAIARDITSRLQAELALVNAHDLLSAEMRRRTGELHEKETLLREIHHRVKNNLQVVSSLLSMQRKLVTDEAAREAFQQSENRIFSMAMIHDFIYQQSKFSSLDLMPYLRRLADYLAATYGKTNVECRVEGAAGALDLEKAIPCGLIVNELISNCFKHAFPGDAKGSIEVRVRRDGGRVAVTVSDDGIGLPAGFKLTGHRSLGLKVVHALATRQLQGRIEYLSGGGSRFAFEFDEAEERAATATAGTVVG